MSDGLKQNSHFCGEGVPLSCTKPLHRIIYWYANLWDLLQSVSHIVIINISDCIISAYLYN